MIRRLADRVRAWLAVLGPLGEGSIVLMLRLLTRFGWMPVAVGVGVVACAVNRYRTWIVWILLVWCAAAWMHAPAEADEPRDEPAGETPTGPDPQDVLDLVRDLIGDDRGVLLTGLRQPFRVADTRAVREVLAAADIRVREGVRTGRGNGPGVHRDDVPPVSPTLDPPSGRPVVAGEATNNNTTNTLRVQSREGMTIINDPADRHRTHSLKKP